eukprot:1173866-Amorphochlora_amoeboformis.AAC.1
MGQNGDCSLSHEIRCQEVSNSSFNPFFSWWNREMTELRKKGGPEGQICETGAERAKLASF